MALETNPVCMPPALEPPVGGCLKSEMLLPRASPEVLFGLWSSELASLASEPRLVCFESSFLFGVWSLAVNKCLHRTCLNRRGVFGSAAAAAVSSSGHVPLFLSSHFTHTLMQLEETSR